MCVTKTVASAGFFSGKDTGQKNFRKEVRDHRCIGYTVIFQLFKLDYEVFFPIAGTNFY